MPRGDRRGPEGFGPMTGRGYGYCAGYEAPGYAAPAPGRGMGRGHCGPGFGAGYGGRGLGRRRGRGYGWGPGSWGAAPWAQPPAYDPEQELDALKRQAAYFEQGLDQVKHRIDELENRTHEE